MWHIKYRDKLFYIIYICLGRKLFVENDFIGTKISTNKKIYNNHNNWIDLLTEHKTKIHLLNDTVNLNLSLNLK